MCIRWKNKEFDIINVRCNHEDYVVVVVVVVAAAAAAAAVIIIIIITIIIIILSGGIKIVLDYHTCHTLN